MTTARLAKCFGAMLLAPCGWAGPGVLPVWDFDSGVFNSLGGGFNSFGGDGCEVILQRTPRVHRGPAGQSLKITYSNAAAPSCGMWMHLFREEAPPSARSFPDMARFPFVSFWILDSARPEDVSIRMADPVWLARDDSRPAGSVAAYLGNVKDGWREVVVPFRDFRLPGSHAAVFVLQFAPGTNGVLHLDDLFLKGESGTRAAPARATASGTPAQTPYRRAMWLWETAANLKDPGRQQRSLSTLRQAAVTDLFLQVPYRLIAGPPPSCELTSQAELRSFLHLLHAAGIRVHALDGYPEFALRSHHEIVLSLIRRMIAFNMAGPEAERFDGVHLDNEPYQLLGFDGPAREWILAQYLELNEKAAAMLHGTGLAFGVDIPFWWDSVDESGQPCCLVTFRGARRNAAEHVLDLVDNAGIMAYRNFAAGVDGIVNHARGEVGYASRGRKQVFVAVETLRPAPEPVVYVAAIQESGWRALPADAALLGLSRFAGYPLRSFADGGHRFAGLAGSGAGFESAQRKLRAELAGLSPRWVTDLRGFQPRLEKSVLRSSALLAEESAGESNSTVWSLHAVESMPPKVTFAGKSKQFLEEILQETRRAFCGEPGFAGDAIHSLESYQDLGGK